MFNVGMTGIDPINALGKLLSADPDFSQAQKVEGRVLTATSYDEQYYNEHLAAGLDYLGHGFWHPSYAAMVSEATLANNVFSVKLWWTRAVPVAQY